MAIDHVRKLVVNKNLEAASHKHSTERKEGGKQQTLKTVLNCKTASQVAKIQICHQWTAGNIPLHKSEKLVEPFQNGRCYATITFLMSIKQKGLL